MKELRLNLRRLDWPLVVVAGALSLYGLLFIGSATPQTGGGAGSPAPDYVLLQLRWILVAFGIALLVLSVPYWRIARFSPLLYALGTGALVATELFGVVTNNARRWLSLGPVSVQPSEFMKPLVVLLLAWILRYRPNLRSPRRLFLPLLLLAAPAFLVAREPDLGTALLLCPGAFAVLYGAGLRRRHIVALAAAAVVLAPLVYAFGLKAYQRDRIWTFLSPASADPTSSAYQITVARAMVGSGGLAGHGLYEGPLNTLGYLPFRHTDFILAVVGEEWGFVGCGGLLFLLFLFTSLGYGIALRVREPCGKLIAIGVTTLMSSQMLINAAMVVGLVPNKGVPMPFVSSGGSSYVASAISLALLLNVGMRPVPVIAADDFD